LTRGRRIAGKEPDAVELDVAGLAAGVRVWITALRESWAGAASGECTFDRRCAAGGAPVADFGNDAISDLQFLPSACPAVSVVADSFAVADRQDRDAELPVGANRTALGAARVHHP